MKRFGIVFLLVAVMLTPLMAMAQEPGEGGLIIEGSTRTSANLTSLVPIRCSGVDCSNPGALMFPTLVAIDVDTQNFDVAAEGSVVSNYEVSEDGLTYTFTLRDDVTWSDGTPMTAWDFYFTYLAIQQGEAVGLSSSYAAIQRDVVNAEVIDDQTLALTLAEASCLALSRMALPATPAHAYGWTPDATDFDWSTLIDHPMDLTPTVTAGPFKFNRLEPGTAIYLEADQTYFAPTNEAGVMPEGYVFLDTPDENVMIERFLSYNEGEPNYLREPGTFQAILESDANYLNAPGRVWHYVALNLADPSNPQNGLDEEGNPIDQGIHPIFGDVRVRQALQYGVNIDEIINGPLNGNATAMVAGTIPTAWTLNPDLERRAYDPDMAMQLLDEAGWTDADGDGVRECTSCTTAEEGTPLFFEMMNVGDIRNDVSLVLQDQWAQIGVEVEVVVLDFNAMYDDNMGAQTFDAAVAGWRGALPFDPDQRSFWGAETDIFGEGYGFNFGSYYNAEFEELGAQVNTVEGCGEEDRKEIAYRMQEILHEEQPYIWLYALNSVYAAAPSIQGFDPRPNFGNWNADAWTVAQ